MDENKQNVIKKDDYIFGLDIGSSKINLFVGAIEGESVRVLECGDFPLENPDAFDSVVETLEKAVHLLESSTSIDVHNVYVGIAGRHVLSYTYKGLITLPTSEVRDADIEAVVKQASTVPSSAGQIIHVFPGEFTLDEETGIKNPKGKTGCRLGVDVQVVTSRQNAIMDISKCVESAGLTIADFVLEPLAAASAVLTDDERELGVALIDIGAGSADIAVFVGNSVRYTASLDLAGNVITSDISKCLSVPISISKAEEIKKKFGTCKLSNLIEDEMFPVPAVGGRGDVQCSRKLLANVISARVSEIFNMLAKDLKRRRMDVLINGGVVITGGCCALEGIESIAEKSFGKPVRIGCPSGMSGIQDAFQKPSYATGIGLLYYAAKQHRENKKRETGTQISVSVKKGLQRFKDFVKTYF